MTKTTHIRRRKPLMGPSSFRGEFTNIIISGSMAGRHGTGALAETFHVEVTAMKLGVRAQLKCHWLLKSKLFPHQYIFSNKATPPNLAKQLYQLVTQAFKYMKLWGTEFQASAKDKFRRQ